MSRRSSLAAAHHAATALGRRERRFAQAFEAAPVGMALVGPEGRFLRANRALCALVGSSVDELLARTIQDLTHPDDRERTRQDLGQLLAGATETCQLEQRLIHTCGADIWVQSNIVLARDNAGAPLYFIAHLADITGRKRAEQALHESRRTLQLFVEYAPAAIAMFDREMRYLAASRRYIIDYHLPAADVIGRSHYEIFPEIPQRWRDIHRRCLAGAIETAEADPFPRADGTIDWVRWAIHPWYTAEGAIGGIILFSEVITSQVWLEQQRASLTERLNLATQAAGMGIWDWDILRNEIVWDDQMYALYGLQPGEFGGAYEAWLRGVHPEDRDLSNDISTAAVRGERDYDTEFRVLWPDGSVHWLKAAAQVFRDQDGTPLRMVGVNYEITERRRVEDELRRSNAELEQFAYVASHDLQEPLRAVTGMVQLLAQKYQGQLDERADTYIGYAVEAAIRMQALINDLLAYSRVDRRGRALAPVQLSACLQAALQNLDVAIRESGAVITCDTLPIVQADAMQLVQLLQNLLGNAIKFRGARAPQIHVGAQQLNDAWQITVRDNGIGIEPQYFERIFLVFQRLHTRREYSGNGIGLALCKKIVERHGGTIGVESQPGQGTTFTFTLPLRSRP